MGTADDDAATLVLASYNHAAFIPDAIASFAAQDHPHLRLIVTDDASTDDSVSVIEQHLSLAGLEATTVFHRSNAGICATFNEALALVRTPYVGFLAADDWMAPARFSSQVSALAGAPGAAVAYSDMWVTDETGVGTDVRYSDLWEGEWASLTQGDDVFGNLLRMNWIPAPSVLSRTQALRDLGGYDETLSYEDYDMWLRLSAAGHEFAYVDAPLVSWRRTANSLTEQLDRSPRSEQDVTALRILSKHLGRDRATDSILAPRLLHMAVQSHKAGSRSPVIAATLRRCVRAKPSLSALAYAAVTTVAQSRRDA